MYDSHELDRDGILVNSIHSSNGDIYGFANQSAGSAEVSSMEGQGTTVTLRFPQVKALPVSEVAAPAQTNGSANDRVHLSFHSNAGGGRGAVGLITSVPTPNQANFALLCGREVQDDLPDAPQPLATGSPTNGRFREHGRRGRQCGEGKHQRRRRRRR
jgi:hypothetical protein